jgi:hypothetical protein
MIVPSFGNSGITMPPINIGMIIPNFQNGNMMIPSPQNINPLTPVVTNTVPKIIVPAIIIPLPDIKVRNMSIINTSNSSGRIKLPQAQTIIPSIPLKPTKGISTHQGLAIAHTPQEMITRNIMNIDVKRLNAGRKKKNDGTYPLNSKDKINPSEGLKPEDNLSDIAASIGLKKTGTKKELVERIRAEILKINPNAFD